MERPCAVPFGHVEEVDRRERPCAVPFGDVTDICRRERSFAVPFGDVEEGVNAEGSNGPFPTNGLPEW